MSTPTRHARPLPIGAPPPRPYDEALPVWPSTEAVEAVSQELRHRPPLVAYTDCWALRRRLASVALGHRLVVQGGDCAEMYDDESARSTLSKRAQLDELGRGLQQLTGLPAVLIGRMAGQFAKPRSCAYEPGPGAARIPVYRGDAVNSADPVASRRVPDPRRMLTAYDHSARVIGHLALGSGPQVWTSHEAILSAYEEPLVRTDGDTGGRYGSSGHLLWVGERTRSPSSPQVSLLRGVDNAVGVKLGPDATPAELGQLIDQLDPLRQPGRLVLIPRMGADRVTDRLPALVRAATAAGIRPVWICDPMHGNTVKLPDGRKTRALEDVVAEVRGFVSVLSSLGHRPGGLHLEVTPDDVTECVETRAQLADPWLPRYRSGCDPRLSPVQARQVAAAFASALEQGAAA